ncbi:hypothetical protein [Nocardia brasiliensis]|uniref:hypothetical protein n=1 Tax=Nocardia brasiliensis TaxID=37326 RepID=UPI0024586834|nr:hypothetical protein [Nocardia brasiliensis]
MRSKPSTVGIAPGNGLVARFGGIVVYLSGETASTERILGTIEAVAEFDRPRAALAPRLAAVDLGRTPRLAAPAAGGGGGARAASCPTSTCTNTTPPRPVAA